MSEIALPPWLFQALTGVERWPLSVLIGQGPLFPLLETLHVIGVGLLLGSLLMVDLRLLGLAARRLDVRDLSGDLIPWSVCGFGLAVASGLGMAISNPVHYAGNPAFLIKLGLVGAAGANMLAFRLTVWRRAGLWAPGGHTPPPSARWAGAASLAFWVGAIAAGRWIAFL